VVAEFHVIRKARFRERGDFWIRRHDQDSMELHLASFTPRLRRYSTIAKSCGTKLMRYQSHRSTLLARDLDISALPHRRTR
jgi:hypothetical protein